MSAVSTFPLEQSYRIFHNQVAQFVRDVFDTIVHWFQDWTDYFFASRPLPLSERSIQRDLPPGIVNLGRSCFLNLVLQDLAAEPIFYGEMLTKELAQQSEESLASFQLRGQFQTQLKSIIECLNRKQTPSKHDLQTLMSQMKRLGWKPLNRELTFFERLTSWILGAQGDSFRTYNFIRAVLEEEDFSIDRPHDGYFTNWIAENAPERCVVHLTSDTPNYINALKKVRDIASEQMILVRLAMPLEAQINHPWESVIRHQDLCVPFHLKQVHVIRPAAHHGAHTYIYKRRLNPEAPMIRDPHPYEEINFQWLRYDDKEVSIVPIEEMPKTGISSLVFSTTSD